MFTGSILPVLTENMLTASICCWCSLEAYMCMFTGCILPVLPGNKLCCECSLETYYAVDVHWKHFASAHWKHAHSKHMLLVLIGSIHVYVHRKHLASAHWKHSHRKHRLLVLTRSTKCVCCRFSLQLSNEYSQYREIRKMHANYLCTTLISRYKSQIKMS